MKIGIKPAIIGAAIIVGSSMSAVAVNAKLLVQGIIRLFYFNMKNAVLVKQVTLSIIRFLYWNVRTAFHTKQLTMGIFHLVYFNVIRVVCAKTVVLSGIRLLL